MALMQHPRSCRAAACGCKKKRNSVTHQDRAGAAHRGIGLAPGRLGRARLSLLCRVLRLLAAHVPIGQVCCTRPHSPLSPCVAPRHVAQDEQLLTCSKGTGDQREAQLLSGTAHLQARPAQAGNGWPAKRRRAVWVARPVAARARPPAAAAAGSRTRARPSVPAQKSSSHQPLQRAQAGSCLWQMRTLRDTDNIVQGAKASESCTVPCNRMLYEEPSHLISRSIVLTVAATPSRILFCHFARHAKQVWGVT